MLGSKLYLLSSIFLTGFVILNTYLNQEEYHATVAYITKSKSILLVLLNFTIALSVLSFKIITSLFFSSLKEAEIQNMESQATHHGFNLIIVLYMLNLDFDLHIAFYISTNIAVCAFHTLASKRVEYVISTQLFTENYPSSDYLRAFFFHIFLIIADLLLMSLESSNSYVSLYILLTYEYIFMGIYASKSLVVFLLHMFEKICHRSGWEGKLQVLSVVEIFYNFSILTIFAVNLMIISKKSVFQIYFVEKSLRAIMNMWKYLSGYLETRKLLSKVNNFPNATVEEIHIANDKCIFCLDHLIEAKKINCGHLFHYKCLRSYFENSSSPKCPTCRADIDEKTIIHHHKSESFSQNLASSFLLQDLPSHVKPFGNPLDIGATAWGLPKAVVGHKVSRHKEKRRHAVENMNDFIVRFYRHPPDQIEKSPEDLAIDEHFKKLKENFLKLLENKNQQTG